MEIKHMEVNMAKVIGGTGKIIEASSPAQSFMLVDS
jgi:hypothetical protein